MQVVLTHFHMEIPSRRALRTKKLLFSVVAMYIMCIETVVVHFLRERGDD